MSKKMAVHFSSNTDQWETPQELFDHLHKLFRFDLDVCALKENSKCRKFFSPKDDGLSKDWIGSCWMNPPYGRNIGNWIEKAHKESMKKGTTVVCLLPARVDTKWFHNFCVKGEVRLIKGRLKFGGHKNSAPFPSMIVVFGLKKSSEGGSIKCFEWERS